MHYRGIIQAHIINVLEGNGKEEAPFGTKKYVAVIDTNGKLITIGTVKKLILEEEAEIKTLVKL